MNLTEVRDEYNRAQRAGQKELKDLISAGRSPYPAVLDEILPAADIDSVVNVGLVASSSSTRRTAAISPRGHSWERC